MTADIPNFILLIASRWMAANLEAFHTRPSSKKLEAGPRFSIIFLGAVFCAQDKRTAVLDYLQTYRLYASCDYLCCTHCCSSWTSTSNLTRYCGIAWQILEHGPFKGTTGVVRAHQEQAKEVVELHRWRARCQESHLRCQMCCIVHNTQCDINGDIDVDDLNVSGT